MTHEFGPFEAVQVTTMAVRSAVYPWYRDGTPGLEAVRNLKHPIAGG